jgi:hypothetical protein
MVRHDELRKVRVWLAIKTADATGTVSEMPFNVDSLPTWINALSRSLTVKRLDRWRFP